VFALVKENQHFSQKRLQNVKKCPKNRFPSPTPPTAPLLLTNLRSWTSPSPTAF
jgi:hypothetical protein